MPGIVRKLIIFTTIDGLVLQPAGGPDHNNPLRIDFKSKSIVPQVKVDPEAFKQSPHLESHGIIGKHVICVQHLFQLLNTGNVSVEGLLISLYRERFVDDCLFLIFALHNPQGTSSTNLWQTYLWYQGYRHTPPFFPSRGRSYHHEDPSGTSEGQKLAGT